MRKRYNPNKLYKTICGNWKKEVKSWSPQEQKQFIGKIRGLLAMEDEEFHVQGYELLTMFGEESLCELLYVKGKFRLKPEVPFHLASRVLEEVSDKNSIWYPLYDEGFFSDFLYPMELMPNGKFYMGIYEVTQDLYESAMGKNPSRFKGDRNPVEKVSWYDAIRFCNKLSELEGLEPAYTITYKPDPADMGGNITFKNLNMVLYGERYEIDEVIWNQEADGYRLPTVKEWIIAAKGGQKYEFAGSDNPDEVAWWTQNSDFKTHPVGQKKPNGFGLYDMSGNVNEWCWDEDPRDEEFRSLRGGGWSHGVPDGYGLAILHPHGGDPHDRNQFCGFRMARNS